MKIHSVMKSVTHWFGASCLLLNGAALACTPEGTQSAAVTQAFSNGMQQADLVFIGRVIRHYKLPSWEKGFEGMVLQVSQDLKGYAPDYVDAALLPTEEVSPTPEQNADYWPTRVGDERLFAAKKLNDAYFVIAAADANDATLYRNCLKLARQLERLKQKKEQEEKYELPPELRIDRTQVD